MSGTGSALQALATVMGLAATVLLAGSCTSDPKTVTLRNENGDAILRLTLAEPPSERPPSGIETDNLRPVSIYQTDPDFRYGTTVYRIEPFDRRPIRLARLGSPTWTRAQTIADELTPQQIDGAPAIAFSCGSISTGQPFGSQDVLVATDAGVAMISRGRLDPDEPGSWDDILDAVEILAEPDPDPDWFDDDPSEVRAGPIECADLDLDATDAPIAYPNVT